LNEAFQFTHAIGFSVANRIFSRVISSNLAFKPATVEVKDHLYRRNTTLLAEPLKTNIICASECLLKVASVEQTKRLNLAFECGR